MESICDLNCYVDNLPRRMLIQRHNAIKYLVEELLSGDVFDGKKAEMVVCDDHYIVECQTDKQLFLHEGYRFVCWHHKIGHNIPSERWFYGLMHKTIRSFESGKMLKLDMAA